MNRTLAFTTLTLFLALFSGCGSGGGQFVDLWEEVEVPPGEEIPVAYVISRDAEAGIAIMAEHQLAGAEYAAVLAGSIKGHPIGVTVFEDDCTSDSAMSVAQDIVEDAGYVAVVGHSCSEACSGAVTVYEPAHQTLVSPSCSATQLTDPVVHEGAFWRTMYDDQAESALAAEFAFGQLGAREALVLSDATMESKNLSGDFAVVFRRLGGKTSTQIDVEGSLVDQLDESVFENPPDLIYAPLSPNKTLTVVETLKDLFPDTPILVSRLAIVPWFTQNLLGEYERVYAVGPGEPEEEYLDILGSYLASNPEGVQNPGYGFAFGFDAMNILIEAIRASSFLRSSQDLAVGRYTLRSSLQSTTAYEGLTGTITCTEWGACGVENLAVYQIRNGEWTVVFIPQ